MNIDDTDNASFLMIPPTEDCWGFYGTIQSNESLGDKDASQAWAEAFRILRSAPWKPSDIAIRNFLRSRWGRHFANAVSVYEGALEERIAKASQESWLASCMDALVSKGWGQRLVGSDEFTEEERR